MKGAKKKDLMAAGLNPDVRMKRCAVYCRVSSDENLDQSFNSIDAQREAGLSFIRSQQAEGWVPLDGTYEDPGFSGGNMERPGLQRLFRDIRSGLVDMVVVYKIDRLSRSLADFAKMVEMFDGYNVSFSAVTQQINSASSMGRLMLNVLLSFAQFEREVTGERIRDKIAAAKAKGMWMGGPVPHGYQVIERKLVVKPDEAKVVKQIFQDFAELRSVAMVIQGLKKDGVNARSGKPFAQQTIRTLLTNRTYIGELNHKEKSHPGLHDPIIDRGLFDCVQEIFEHDARLRGSRNPRTAFYALLGGLLFGPNGVKMLATWSRGKTGQKFRYYRMLGYGGKAQPTRRSMMFAMKEVDRLVLDQVYSVLKSPAMLESTILEVEKVRPDISELSVYQAMQNMAAIWNELYPQEQRKIIETLIERVVLSDQELEITWKWIDWNVSLDQFRPNGIPAELVRRETGGRMDMIKVVGKIQTINVEPSAEGERPVVKTVIPIRHRRKGIKNVIEPNPALSAEGVAPQEKPQFEMPLLIALCRAFYWQWLLDEGRVESGSEIARREGLHPSTVNELLRLTILAPDLIQKILKGEQPEGLSILWFTRNRLPMEWKTQFTAILAEDYN